MTATIRDIMDWLDEAKRKKATHLIVVCDTWDHDNYPVYVYKGDDVRTVAGKYMGQNMQRIDEIYNMHMDLDTQLSATRAYNL